MMATKKKINKRVEKKILTRRVWYIDVGNMPPNRAMQHMENIKKNIIETRKDIDNIGPILYEDYYFAIPANGDSRGSWVEFHDVKID
jgi:Bacteriophage T4-like portal protein (Gp20)